MERLNFRKRKVLSEAEQSMLPYTFFETVLYLEDNSVKGSGDYVQTRSKKELAVEEMSNYLENIFQEEKPRKKIIKALKKHNAVIVSLKLDHDSGKLGIHYIHPHKEPSAES